MYRSILEFSSNSLVNVTNCFSLFTFLLYKFECNFSQNLLNFFRNFHQVKGKEEEDGLYWNDPLLTRLSEGLYALFGHFFDLDKIMNWLVNFVDGNLDKLIQSLVFFRRDSHLYKTGCPSVRPFVRP